MLAKLVRTKRTRLQRSYFTRPPDVTIYTSFRRDDSRNNEVEHVVRRLPLRWLVQCSLDLFAKCRQKQNNTTQRH